MKSDTLVGLQNPNGSSDLLTELQNSEARFKAMFETSAVGIGIMGLDRRIIDANSAMCKMLGIPCKDLIGQTPKIATYPEDYQQSTAEWENLITGKKDYYWSERGKFLGARDNECCARCE
jgi:PAS domain S-box-containing protein